MMTRWGFTVPGGLVERLRKEHALHEATIAYTLNNGIKERLAAKNAEIKRQLEAFGAALEKGL
jgi:hypothetical protein